MCDYVTTWLYVVLHVAKDRWTVTIITQPSTLWLYIDTVWYKQTLPYSIHCSRLDSSSVQPNVDFKRKKRIDLVRKRFSHLVLCVLSTKVVKNSNYLKKSWIWNFLNLINIWIFWIYCCVTNIQLQNIKTAHEFLCPPSFQNCLLALLCRDLQQNASFRACSTQFRQIAFIFDLFSAFLSK